MSSTFTRLPFAAHLFPSRHQSDQQSSSVTTALNLPWHRINGPAHDSLLPELQKMYWNGVKRELAHILLTLRKWQQPEYASTILSDETDNFIHGFDTFIDQVSETSREFAARYEHLREGWDSKTRITYVQALVELSKDVRAERKGTALKMAVRETLEGRKKYSIVERRARMLLQSAGFLDIDKLTEYRTTEEMLSFGKRPAAPQLSLKRFDDSYMPLLEPLACYTCRSIIRGCMFQKRDDHRSLTICEGCYRKHHYGDDLYLKVYKHCVLRDSISLADGQRICRCGTVQHIDSDGRARKLFPVDKTDNHRGFNNENAIKCGLLNLGSTVAEEKYQGTLWKHEKQINLSDLERIDKAREQKRRLKETKSGKFRGTAFNIIRRSSQIDSSKRVAEAGISIPFQEEADEDVPIFLRNSANKHPFGSVHMALRIGPLIIENGVEHTEGGALITSRDPPNLQILRDSGNDINYSLAVSSGPERALHYQYRTGRIPKRYKTVMKQVAGGAFSGLFNEALEDKIIEELLHESQLLFDRSSSEDETMLEQSLGRLIALLKGLLDPRIEIYLETVASRLLDPKTNLHWDFRTNNCQTFCDSLLDQKLFGPLLASLQSQNGEARNPLYLMSFVSRPGSYNKEPVKTKFDVPSGLIEEYLLRFRYGIHDESDIVDTLQEYWYDWGAFGGQIYKYQDLFPWDCTEAFGRYPTICNNCNIAKHTWAFPFDSWSIAALHLTKDRHLYPATDPQDPQPLSDLDWMKNRCTVLLAQDVLLTAAAAMAKIPALHQATEWLHKQANPKKDRLKLGGIHRAQPFSHYFERGKYHHYFVAEWAHLKREDQIIAYKRLRDGKVRMLDVPGTYSSGFGDEDNDDRGCGGCEGSACAGGCAASCGGGCANGCSGGGGGCGGGCSGGCGGGCGGCGG